MNSSSRAIRYPTARPHGPGGEDFVAIHVQDPLVRALPEGEILLAGETQPILVDYPGTNGTGDLQSGIRRTAIDHDNLVSAGARGENLGEVRGLVFCD
jgi:hypothetical protein